MRTMNRQKRERRRKISPGQQSSGLMLAADKKETLRKTCKMKWSIQCVSGEEKLLLTNIRHLNHNLLFWRLLGSFIFSHSHTQGRNLSGMAIADITLLSGFDAINTDLERVRHKLIQWLFLINKELYSKYILFIIFSVLIVSCLYLMMEWVVFLHFAFLHCFSPTAKRSGGQVYFSLWAHTRKSAVVLQWGEMSTNTQLELIITP